MSDMIKFYPTDVFYIPSKIVDQSFKISVQRPPSIDDQDKDLPVIYCTDADVYFDVLSSISTLLHTSGSTLRPYLLVGVGYPTKHPLGSERLRARDLTFEGFP